MDLIIYINGRLMILELFKNQNNRQNIARLMLELLFAKSSHHSIHLLRTVFINAVSVILVQMSQMKMEQRESFVQCLAVLNKWLVMVAWFGALLHVIHRMIITSSRILAFLSVHSVELKLLFFLMKIESIFISENYKLKPAKQIIKQNNQEDTF